MKTSESKQSSKFGVRESLDEVCDPACLDCGYAMWRGRQTGRVVTERFLDLVDECDYAQFIERVD